MLSTQTNTVVEEIGDGTHEAVEADEIGPAGDDHEFSDRGDVTRQCVPIGDVEGTGVDLPLEIGIEIDDDVLVAASE